uniref:Uncharacterized protein n=1 Tax=Sus scrofa TaxID=9823 RepID=A0A8D1Q3L1_PIG
EKGAGWSGRCGWPAPTHPGLPQGSTGHTYLDLHLVEGLAIVDTYHAAHHLGQDDHVSQVRLHYLWLLHGWRLLLGLAQALEQRVLLPPQTSVQPPPLPCAVQLVEVHAAVGELAEGPLLLLLYFRLREPGKGLSKTPTPTSHPCSGVTGPAIPAENRAKLWSTKADRNRSSRAGSRQGGKHGPGLQGLA